MVPTTAMSRANAGRLLVGISAIFRIQYRTKNVPPIFCNSPTWNTDPKKSAPIPATMATTWNPQYLPLWFRSYHRLDEINKPAYPTKLPRNNAPNSKTASAGMSASSNRSPIKSARIMKAAKVAFSITASWRNRTYSNTAVPSILKPSADKSAPTAKKPIRELPKRIAAGAHTRNKHMENRNTWARCR